MLHIECQTGTAKKFNFDPFCAAPVRHIVCTFVDHQADAASASDDDSLARKELDNKRDGIYRE